MFFNYFLSPLKWLPTRSFVACALAIGSCGTALALGTISGITATPANPTINQQVQFKVSMTGAGECGLRLVYGGGEPADNTLANKTAGAGGGIVKTMTKAGVYNVQAIGSPSLNPACLGQANLSITVKEAAPGPVAATPLAAAAGISNAPPKVVMGPSSPAVCPPSPYFEVEKNFFNGSLRCKLPNPTCPVGWKQSAWSDATGQISCVPAETPTCPANFEGSVLQGVLKCAPKPQPKIACPAGPVQSNPWGTTYYTDSWNFVGCSVNLAPAK